MTDWEEANVPKKYLDEFAAASSFEKFYGCTLMAYVQTPEYWFAFHLGDGKGVVARYVDKVNVRSVRGGINGFDVKLVAAA